MQSFYDYCKSRIPELDQINLKAKEICDLMENHKDYKTILIINMPDQSGKSLFCFLYLCWHGIKCNQYHLCLTDQRNNIAKFETSFKWTNFNNIFYFGSTIAGIGGVIIDQGKRELDEQDIDYFINNVLQRVEKEFPMIILQTLLGKSESIQFDNIDQEGLHRVVKSFSYEECFPQEKYHQMLNKILEINRVVEFNLNEVLTQTRMDK